MVCIHFGMPREPVNRALLKTADWAGMLYASSGFSLLYAALDQGNRPVAGIHAGAVQVVIEFGRFVKGQVHGDGLLLDETGDVILHQLGLNGLQPSRHGAQHFTGEQHERH